MRIEGRTISTISALHDDLDGCNVHMYRILELPVLVTANQACSIARFDQCAVSIGLELNGAAGLEASSTATVCNLFAASICAIASSLVQVCQEEFVLDDRKLDPLWSSGGGITASTNDIRTRLRKVAVHQCKFKLKLPSKVHT